MKYGKEKRHFLLTLCTSTMLDYFFSFAIRTRKISQFIEPGSFLSSNAQDKSCRCCWDLTLATSVASHHLILVPKAKIRDIKAITFNQYVFVNNDQIFFIRLPHYISLKLGSGRQQSSCSGSVEGSSWNFPNLENGKLDARVEHWSTYAYEEELDLTRLEIKAKPPRCFN